MQMKKGQRWDIAAGEVAVSVSLKGLPLQDLAIAAVLLQSNGQAFEKPVEAGASSACRSVRSDPQDPARFFIQPNTLPSAVERVTLVLALRRPALKADKKLGALTQGTLQLTVQGTTYLMELDPLDLAWSDALLGLEVYRRQQAWRASFLGEGLTSGTQGPLARAGLGAEVWPGEPQAPASPLSPTQAFQACIAPASWPGEVQPQLPGGLSSAVAMVLVEREEGAANATAFFITPGGLAVTCAHVVAGAQKLSLLVEGQNKIRSARVCAVDEEADVALIAPHDHAGSASWFRLSPPASPRSLGTEVGVYGYPLGGIFGLSLTYSQGVINSLHQGTDKRILQLDAGAAPGSSGGPVFRRADGVVVGVLSSGLRNNPGGMLVNFAVDSERLWFNRWLEHLP